MLERLDLAEFVSGLTTRLSALMPATARLDVVAPDGPVWIRGDAGALERVVLNLVTNAADAVAGGGHVRVAVTRAAASNGGAPVPSAASAAIEVSDDGVGMDASVQARLFEPFFTTKTNAAATAAGAGTGPGSARAGARPPTAPPRRRAPGAAPGSAWPPPSGSSPSTAGRSPSRAPRVRAAASRCCCRPSRPDVAG